MYRSVMESLREHLMDVGEPRQLVLPCPGCGDNRVIMARQVTKEEVESNPIFAEFRERSRASTPQIEELRRNSRYNFDVAKHYNKKLFEIDSNFTHKSNFILQLRHLI